ncbi:hypothetical protein IAR55_002854 [Kwoniella newhampshirensis]|uniref:SAP domain-containing protein n=1 Tax=Kwoniella newhampshirensis TaxID=1651941 RepID=A0AAW0Z1G1_9TREE
MLRRKVSAGLLRATNPSTNAVTPLCPPSPTRPRARSLASAVLLSSQRNWKNETVVALKTELKKRGLSQQGNKATLVSRLESAETSSLLPPLPPFPNNARTLSTTAFRSQPPKKATKDSTTAAPGPATAVSADALESVTSTGPQVSSQRTEALKPEPVAPEQVTVAPGLPNSKVAANQGGAKLDMSFPSVKADEQIEQIIPLTPDNFSSNAALASSSAPALPEAAAKVLTVASASTHLSGGPVHGTHSHTDSHTLEVAEDAPDMLSSIPSLSSLAGSVLSAPASAWKATGLKFPEIGLPKEGKGSEYEYDGKGLNDEEKRGAWVLAGVVGLGLFLGGGSRKSGAKKGKESGPGVGDLMEEGKKMMKGDAAWEKASGAGVVGHGSRKD